MGGSSSTQRTVTLREDEPVIAITESVKRRLLGQEDVSDCDSRKPPCETATAKQDERAQHLFPAEQPQPTLQVDNQCVEQTREAMKKQACEMYGSATEEFAKAVEEVEGKFMKVTSTPVCEDLHNQVLQCYREYPMRTLNCANQVNLFTECVQKQRECKLYRNQYVQGKSYCQSCQ